MASHEEVAQRFGAEVVALRSEGLSMARIAERVGLSYQAVRFVLDPESERARRRRDNEKAAARKRAWENEHDRRACSVCGGPMGIGAHRKGFERCGACVSRDAALRAAEMVRLRNEEGLPNREIAGRLGCSLSAVATELSRQRRAGVRVARDPYMADRRAVLNA